MDETRFEVGTEIGFRSSHVMPGVEGPEGVLHEHEYRVEVVVSKEALDDKGMVCDLDVLDAALADLRKEVEGRDLEVIDLRTLSPLDLTGVYDSVRRTGRCVVVHEAPSNLGLGAEIAARITEECFYSLESPVLRVTGYDTPYPAARLEEEYLPDLDRVLDAVDRTFGW